MLYDVESVLLSVVFKDMLDSLKNVALFSSLYPYLFEMWFCRSSHKEVESFPNLSNLGLLWPVEHWEIDTDDSENRPQETWHTLAYYSTIFADEAVLDKLADLLAYQWSMNECKHD